MVNPSAPDSLRIDARPQERCTVVTISGSATMDVSGILRERLIEHVNPHRPHLVIDLSGLEFISSLGLGGIVAAYLRCRRYQGGIQLVGPRPAIADLLSVTKLDKLLPIRASIDDAIAASG